MKIFLLSVALLVIFPLSYAQFRLVNGRNSKEGRIEVYHSGQWGTICDDKFGANEGGMICRALGFDRVSTLAPAARFGEGRDPIWLDDVRCPGNASTLADCIHRGWGLHNCGHSEDMGLICATDDRTTVYPDIHTTTDQYITDQPGVTHGPMTASYQYDAVFRLVNGASAHEGRIEVYHAGRWGTVCDDYFGIEEGNMVCQMLGYPRVLTLAPRARYGQGRDPIWLDDLRCPMNANTLADCRHLGWGSHNCGHSEDMGLICATSDHATSHPNVPMTTAQEITTPQSVSETGSYQYDAVFRLVNGARAHEGRIEVYHAGRWGTVCDDYFGTEEGNMVCQMLGYDRVLTLAPGARFGQGGGLIWLDDLRCPMNANTLADCTHRGWGSHNCGHSEDMGLICATDSHATTYPNTPMPTEQESTNQPEVTDSPTTASTQHDAVFRLVNGARAHEGRIEVYHAGRWGTVCDDYFGTEEGNMVCQMLGYDRVSNLAPGARFGQGRGPIWLDDLRCPMNANTLADCTHRGWGSHNCGHSEDMGLICATGDHATHPNVPMTTAQEITTPRSVSEAASYQYDAVFRLVNGTRAHEGRIEVYHAGRWGTVCDDYFGTEEGNMVCQMLGYDRVLTLAPSARFGQGRDPIWLDDLRCPMNANTLADCTHRGWGSHNCGHLEDMGLICGTDDHDTTYPNTPIPTEQEITTPRDVSEAASYQYDAVFRLVNGTRAHEGRIEVYHAGRWGTVCDDYFGTEEGNMVCQMLGYDRALTLAHRARFGQGRDPIWLDDLRCPMNANTLADCAHRGWGSHNCGHHEDMGLICATDDHGTTYPNTPIPTEQEITDQPEVTEGPTTASSHHDAVFRLVNGTRAHEGRIEVYHAGRWGTVCDDYFGTEEGNMVCQMLGYDRVLTLAPSARFGQGRDPIWLDDLRCPMNANTLADCTHRGWGSHNCGHLEDMGLICGTDDHDTTYPNTPIPTEQEITTPRDVSEAASYQYDAVFRLVNGTRAHEGRIEVYHAGRWGTVCDDYFGTEEGNMVCQMLGYDRALTLAHRARFGQGRDPIWLDDLRCPMNANTLADCAHRGWGSHNCGHHEDMGLICATDDHGTTYPNTPIPTEQEITDQPEVTEGPTTASSHHDAVFRLVNGSTAHEGRIEVYHAGRWGTVCDDYFGTEEGNMVCQMLGYDRVLTLAYRARYGQGRDPIWLDDLRCPANANTLTNCTHRGWGSHNCGHHEDMGLICATDDHATSHPNVVMTTVITAVPEEDTTVSYQHDAVFRLVNGASEHEGRIEVYHAGRWGTVCDDYFGTEEGNMVCQMLGYDRVLTLAPRARFGQGRDPIWLDDLRCPTNASTLAECSHRGWGSHNCRHSEDMGLICATDDHVTSYPNVHVTTAGEITVQPEVFRLVNGRRAHEGRIEVYHAGRWGTVCDDYFGTEEGNMVCQMLGYDRVITLAPSARFGQGRDPIWLDDLRCPANASTLADCTHRGWGSHNCRHSEDMGLVCGADDPVFRLVNGASAHEGRIEVYHAGRWGTICDDYFGIEEGNLVCRMLGYQRVSILAPRARFGQGRDPIWLDDLRCPVNARTLSDCSHNNWEQHDCRHNEDMGVICARDGYVTSNPNAQFSTYGPEVTPTYGPDETAFRLVNGATTLEGRVEVYHAGRWGTVCDDYFGVDEGNMVCRMLGYDRVASLAPRAIFGRGRDPIWLDDLRCPVNARTLADCTHRGWGTHNCAHSEDMGLRCALDVTAQPPEMTTFYPGNSDIEYRLVGASRRKGRIEVLHNGRWGTICDDEFGWEEAHSVCRQLGFRVAISLHPAAQLGAGTGPIWLDDLRCSRDDLDLERCSHRGWGVHNCGHHEDMGVRCGY